MSNTKTFTFKCTLPSSNHVIAKANNVTVQIKENYSTEYSNFVWPCAQVLSEFICANYQIFTGKVILELGCGTGICAIVAGKIGSHIYLTDKFNSQQSLDLCRENVQLNGVQGNLLPIEWGNFTGPIPKVDYIIGSDCLYDETDFEDLLCTVSLLLKNSENPEEATFYFAHQLRSSAHSIECLSRKWHLKCRTLAFQPQTAETDRQVIELYEIKSE